MEKKLLATLILTMSSGVALAMPLSSFQELDANEDSQLSQQAAAGGMQQGAFNIPGGSSSLPAFDELDINKDGMINRTEYEAYRLEQSGQGSQSMQGRDAMPSLTPVVPQTESPVIEEVPQSQEDTVVPPTDGDPVSNGDEGEGIFGF